jgi:hypothetical protein
MGLRGVCGEQRALVGDKDINSELSHRATAAAVPNCVCACQSKPTRAHDQFISVVIGSFVDQQEEQHEHQPDQLSARSLSLLHAPSLCSSMRRDRSPIPPPREPKRDAMWMRERERDMLMDRRPPPPRGRRSPSPPPYKRHRRDDDYYDRQ